MTASFEKIISNMQSMMTSDINRAVMPHLLLLKKESPTAYAACNVIREQLIIICSQIQLLGELCLTCSKQQKK